MDFDISKKDFENLRTIVDMMEAAASYPINRLTLEMDITATHLNGCPLDLEKLMRFDEFNFMHDVIGISRHINRNTGKLMNHFLPRCSL